MPDKTAVHQVDYGMDILDNGIDATRWHMDDSDDITYRATSGLIRYERRRALWRRVKQVATVLLLALLVGLIAYGLYAYLSTNTWWQDIPIQKWRDQYL